MVGVLLRMSLRIDKPKTPGQFGQHHMTYNPIVAPEHAQLDVYSPKQQNHSLCCHHYQRDYQSQNDNWLVDC